MTDKKTILNPQGFKTCVANIGIKDKTRDFVCILSNKPCNTSGVFTQSSFAGPSVTISRKNIEDGVGQAIVAISKNANVANGKDGEDDALQIIDIIASKLDIKSDNILIASTGVIGRKYPIDKITSFLHSDEFTFIEADFDAASVGIMTTDTISKAESIKVGDATITGIAKGVGMIEPNMATLLAFFATDADISKEDLDNIFRRVVDKTFNCVSVDTDTSTSDTAIILANGVAGKVDLKEFEDALQEISTKLVKMIASDGEGATKLIEVVVEGASSYRQAKIVAKSIVNSPLVKTAIYGADPNWGRVAMAIGKCDSEDDIVQEKVKISFSGMEVFPNRVSEEELEKLTKILQNDEVTISVDLSIGEYSATVWGCDLSAEYVRINGEYTT